MLNLESVDPAASVFLENTAELISAADAVIVVLAGKETANSLFEAGMAIGLGKPLLVVAEDVAEIDGQIPDRILSALPRVRAKLTDGDALGFHVEAFLDGVRQKSSETVVTGTAPRISPPKGSTMRRSQPASPLETRLLNAFETAVEISAVHLEPQLNNSRRFRPDFAVWLDSSTHVIPNPLIVELKGRRAAMSGHRDRWLEQLQSYAYDTGVGAVMLVEDLSAPLSIVRLNPVVFQVGLRDLEVLLNEQGLIQEMLRVRNILAHSAG